MSLTDVVFAGKYKIEKLIGEGAFGKIYSAKSTDTHEAVALKLEPLGRKRSQLLEEAKVYKVLQGNTGIPKTYCVSTEAGYHGLVMELLGPSMEALLSMCGKRLTLPTVLMVAEQMVARIEALHSKGLLHRDIKPENFTIGRGENTDTVYLIDYGLVKRYRNPKTKIHIPFKQNKKLAGTARYSSINTHMGIEQSRRDDIEGIGYTLIYLAKGELPWQGIKADNKKEKYNKIMEKKCDIPIETLCKGLPNEFVAYMYYCRALQFEDKPDYSQLRKQFRDCFYRNRLERGFNYDWIKLGVDLNSYKKPGDSNDSNKAEDEQREDHKERPSRDISNEEGPDRQRNRSADIRPQHGRASQDQLPIPGLKLGSGTPDDGLIKKSALSIPGPVANKPPAEPVVASGEEEKKVVDKKKDAKDAQDEDDDEEEYVRKNSRAFDISKLVQGLPSVLLKIAKEAKKKPKIEGKPPTGKKGGKDEENKTPGGPSQTTQGRLLDKFVAANSIEVRLEDKIKDVPVAVLLRQMTHELTDRSSCNFKFVDIVENRALLDDTIPTEKPFNCAIEIPACTYINNSRHWQVNRRRRWGSNIVKSRTQQKKSTTLIIPGGSAPIRTQCTGQSSQMHYDKIDPLFLP